MEKENYYTCPIDFTISLIGDKWSMWILWSLLDGPLRFNELKRVIPGITEKMLIQQLKKFEKNNIVSRKAYAEVPPKVEYQLTNHGESLKTIMLLIQQWGEEHLSIQRCEGSISINTM
ncbi:winged helix-turn-helix transcriptional regulator [Faecalispora anaeroviscerum]|uniref:winged helix-turn-helix transcriptional regulator n=1 Tax=Faecalispora anaeroviscerum TaxID=2991836 RepID=UPI0024B8E086|nr:helix-turn-helix domain-containing protein [Faecalispora anaeroviscerum]